MKQETLQQKKEDCIKALKRYNGKLYKTMLVYFASVHPYYAIDEILQSLEKDGSITLLYQGKRVLVQLKTK